MTIILGEPGAVSWGDGIFRGESLQQEQESPWAFTLTERVPEAFELPLADWPDALHCLREKKTNSFSIFLEVNIFYYIFSRKFYSILQYLQYILT